MIRSPVLWKRFKRISRPHSSSNATHRRIDSRAHNVHISPCWPVRSPYDERTPRVSSPDVDRELPGPYASTSVTLAPRRRRFMAVKLPHPPAPMTTTSGDAVVDRLELAGRRPGTAPPPAGAPPTRSIPALAP